MFSTNFKKLNAHSLIDLVLILAVDWEAVWDCQLDHTYMVSPCSLGFSQYGSWSPGVSIQRQREQVMLKPYCPLQLALGVMHVTSIMFYQWREFEMSV